MKETETKRCDICKMEIDPKDDFIRLSLKNKQTHMHYDCFIGVMKETIRESIHEFATENGIDER